MSALQHASFDRALRDTLRMQRWPTLSSWMQSASTAHPLWPLLDDADDHGDEILDAFDTLIRYIEAAAPNRWLGKRRDFRGLKTDPAFYQFRAEMVVAARLARAGVAFEFGDTKTANPDLVLESGLGIEVTARDPGGVETVYEAVQTAITPTPRLAVHLDFEHYPVRIKPEHCDVLTENVIKAAKRVSETGKGQVVEHVVVDAANGATITIQAQVLPVESLGKGFRVTWETRAEDLTTSMEAVERQLGFVLEREQKAKQARSMPCLLVVDVSRLGSAWMRPPDVWAAQLGKLVPPACPFIGVAVFTPSLQTADCLLTQAARPGLTNRDQQLLNDLFAILLSAADPVTAATPSS
jgi:hypothetical protein